MKSESASLPANRFLDDIFVEWLSLPSTGSLVEQVIQGASEEMPPSSTPSLHENQEPSVGAVEMKTVRPSLKTRVPVLQLCDALNFDSLALDLCCLLHNVE